MNNNDFKYKKHFVYKDRLICYYNCYTEMYGFVSADTKTGIKSLINDSIKLAKNLTK